MKKTLKFLRFIMLSIVLGVLLAAILVPATAMAMSAAGADVSTVTDVVKVIKEYLPLLAFVLLGIGQLLKKIPGFPPWILPIIMAGVGLAIGIVLGFMINGPPLSTFAAALEGLLIGLAATGLFELGSKVSSANKDST